MHASTPFTLAVACALLWACAPHQSHNVAPKANIERPDAHALVQAARRYAAAGDMVRAEQYFSAALSSGADERAVIPELLRVCVASQHYRLATEYAEAALARHP